MAKEIQELPERLGRAQQLKNTFFYYCLWCGMSFFAALPMTVTVTVGRIGGFFGYYLLRRYRERARKHLTEALGTEYSPKEIDNIIKKLFRI